MYIPPSNAEHDVAALFAFIEAHPLGILVTSSASDGLFATHLPLLVHRDRGPFGVLEGHVARANPHHRQLDAGAEALVIFAGPDAYITPAWYEAKREHGRVVPTWNYVAVHVYATPRVVDDPAFLKRHLESLTSRHESPRAEPWAVSDAPADYVAQQMKAIVGVELAITRLEGKWKMSQNRSGADIDGVVRGLRESGEPAERTVAEIVEARRTPEK
ncbi:MAG: Negative transcriptional regulator [Gemmatimonadetes bacterium]|nr:Negative transcriptional regulator [Gemmatimonadota bacterium]